MKENVIDVLMYLFETYVDTEEEPEPDQNELRIELSRAGFGDAEIERALEWLDGLTDQQESLDYGSQTAHGTRIYNDLEHERIDGRIIAVVGGVTQIGQYQVVVTNRGSDDGLSMGDVLTVYQAGQVVKDRVKGGRVKLPDEQAGTVMIFKTYDRISYGLVMEATQAIHIHDAVRNPT